MKIKNNVIIVTGASAGIGKATAKLLTQQGATVVLAARSTEKLEALSKELPNSFVVTTDMSDPASIKNLIESTQKKYGRIDILINNAGQGMYGALESINSDKYKKIIDLNVIGPLVAMQQVIPIMRSQGGGVIINISSMVSKMNIPYLGAYASTKYALNALTLTARAELEKDHIIVSLMHPGMTATDFGKNAIKADAVAQGMQSRRREGMPEPDSAEDVAKKILESIETEKPETYMNSQAEAMAKNK